MPDMETVWPEDVTRFRVGQKVKVKVPVEVLRTVQEGHGGFTPKMCDSMALQGEVMEVTEKGDLRVKYPNNICWTLNPEAVQLVQEERQAAEALAPEPQQSTADSLGYTRNFLYSWEPTAPSLEASECAICSENEDLCKVEPCGHKITCTDCTSRMKKCLTCRETILRRITNENPRDRVFTCGHSCCHLCLPNVGGICHMCRTPFRNPVPLY
ncbi:hypothetical protein O3M35_001449 [Rhynocoris fuscipes]|uniref:RING-type domain-containing protein n=1 Tax=Rhynocoris fuscipes TaxID=488301 RepID=A0AAW1CRF2_9HEMI